MSFPLLKKCFDHIEEILGSIILAVMAVVTFANVVTRYVITYPLAFTEEITVSMFVWIVLLGASVAFRKNAQLAMSFFYDLMPQSVRKLFFFFSTGMSLTFFALLIWLGSIQVWDEWELGVTTDALAIPAAIYSAGIPLISTLIILRILQFARAALREGTY